MPTADLPSESTLTVETPEPAEKETPSVVSTQSTQATEPCGEGLACGSGKCT